MSNAGILRIQISYSIIYSAWFFFKRISVLLRSTQMRAWSIVRLSCCKASSLWGRNLPLSTCSNNGSEGWRQSTKLYGKILALRCIRLVISICEWLNKDVPVTLMIGDVVSQLGDGCLVAPLNLPIDLLVICVLRHMFDFLVSTYSSKEYDSKSQAFFGSNVVCYVRGYDAVV